MVASFRLSSVIARMALEDPVDPYFLVGFLVIDAQLVYLGLGHVLGSASGCRDP